MPDVDLVVVGAGFAGLATARVVQDAGLSAVVLERRSALDDEGSELTVQPVGFAALQELGLLDPCGGRS